MLKLKPVNATAKMTMAAKLLAGQMLDLDPRRGWLPFVFLG
jgi:hypothetical protein